MLGLLGDTCFAFLELCSAGLPTGPSHLWNLLQNFISLIDVFPSANLANSGILLGTDLVVRAEIGSRLQLMHVKQSMGVVFESTLYG